MQLRIRLDDGENVSQMRPDIVHFSFKLTNDKLTFELPLLLFERKVFTGVEFRPIIYRGLKR